jgi:hypothetical protein
MLLLEVNLFLKISRFCFSLFIDLDVADQSSVPVDVSVSQSGSCTLECQATGTPLPQIVWTKDGKEIKTNEHFFLEASPTGLHRLIIKNVQFEHAGRYVANVKHKILTQFMNFNVIITGTNNSTFPLPEKIHNFCFFRKETRNNSICYN